MANNNYISMDTLKEISFRVTTGMIAVFPRFTQEEEMKEEILDVSHLESKFNGCYTIKKVMIGFVSDNEVFVTPYTDLAMLTLHSAGFCERDFICPFCYGDYPKFEKDKLNTLCRSALQADFVAHCISYCDEHRIGTISEETLRNCFEIPATGIKIKHPHFDGCYYPINSNRIFSYAGLILKQLGHFCTNNRKVVFVYRDGKTYVAKGYKILNELRAAGYIETSMYVPLSNGEQIIDPVLKERWESVTE